MAVPHTLDHTPWNIHVFTRTDHHASVSHVEVHRNAIKTRYERTNRGAADFFHPLHGELTPYYPIWNHFLKSFQEKKVLDLGCGDGRFVDELNANGVIARGLDLYLNPRQIQNRVAFLQGDAFHIPLERQTFDVAFSLYSVFFYEPSHRLQHLLIECAKVVRPSGVLFLGPCLNPYRKKEILDAAPKTGWVIIPASAKNDVLQLIRG